MNFTYKIPVFNANQRPHRFLCVGDPHFQPSNLDLIDSFVQQLKSIVETQGIDTIVLMGDLLHTHERLRTEPMNAMLFCVNELRRTRANVFIIVGNHDYINNRQFQTTNHWMNALKEWENVSVIDKATWYNGFVFVPYVPNGRFEEALETLVEHDWREANIVFGHQEMLGCKMGAIESRDGDKWTDSDPFLVLGHIHLRQRLADNIFYVGSSIQHAYAEKPDKSVSIIDLDAEGMITVESIVLDLPRKLLKYLTVADAYNFSYDKPIGPGCDRIRLSVAGTTDEIQVFSKSAKYSQLVSQGIEIRLKFFESDPSSAVQKSSNEVKVVRVARPLHRFQELMFEWLHSTDFKKETVQSEAARIIHHHFGASLSAASN